MSSQKSKRLLCKLNAIVLLIMLISLCAAVFGAEEPNIFINGGFELLDANGLPVGWRKYTPVGGSPDNLQLSAEAYAGERAVLIDVRDLDRARITWIQPFIGILEPSATYKFSAYYRTDGDPRARLQAQIYSETGTQLDERPSLELPPSIDWRLAELIFTYPQEAHRIQLGLWVWLGGRGRVWFDEASLVKIEKGGTHIVPVDSENISETGEHLFPSNFPPPIEFDLSQAKDFSQPLSMEELRSRIPQGRPRLFARPETLEELRQKKDRPGFAALIWNKIRTSARSAAFKPLPPEPP
ncbi:MAG TPA: hypothetical protein GXX29_12970, partial [Firmicutes bacterium]|nr:hypothetical protein [Bacillota bacterium]